MTLTSYRCSGHLTATTMVCLVRCVSYGCVRGIRDVTSVALAFGILVGVESVGKEAGR
jgi:hypothetical protein